MAGIKVPTYERQTQFVSPYRAPTATAEQMGAGIGKAVESVGAGITDIGMALMARKAERQKMEDLNYEQAQGLADNKSIYEDFLANRNTATSGAESFSETSAARWTKLRAENQKALLTTGGYRPSQAAIDRARRNSERMAQDYEFKAIDYEDMARRKKAFDDSTKNIEAMQAAAAEYGTLDTASIEMEKALETAKLTLPPEDYQKLEAAAKAGMGGSVTAYLTRLQDRAVSAGSNEERQQFNDEADAHIDAAIARGYMDPANGVEAKRLWKENYQKRAFPTLDPTERQRIGLQMTTGGNIKEQLFQKESGGNYANDSNQFGYAGGFQFGAPLLADLGLYTPGGTENLGTWADTGKNAPGKWSGTFNIPGFPDVRTVQDFLHNPQAQDAAWVIHETQMNQEIANRGLDAFVGQTMDGIPITIDGIKAAMHLGGAAGVEKFLKTSTPVGGAGAVSSTGKTKAAYDAMSDADFYKLPAAEQAEANALMEGGGGAAAAATPADTEFLLSRLAAGHDREHITKMDAPLVGGIAAMIRAAPPEIAAGLGIQSGTRTNARQEQLYEQDKARHGGKPSGMVARPGHSQHEFGNAADLSFNGQRLDKAPKEVIDWVHANAGRFGLNFRLSNEAWHVETAGGLQSSTNPADANGTTMSSYLRMGSNSPSYFDSMPQDQLLAGMNQANVELGQMAAQNARQWSETMAVRKGELSLQIATGKLIDGESILSDDILEPADKAALYRSFQEGREEGSVLRADMDAYSNGQFNVNPFNEKEGSRGDKVWGELTKGADEVSQKALATKFAGDTGYVPKDVMAGLQLGRASNQATTVQTAMTDAERLLQIAPNAFNASEDGRSIRDSVAEFQALQNRRGMDPQAAAAAMIQRRDIEIKTDKTTLDAADNLVKEQAKDMGALTAAVGVTGDLGPDPSFGTDQQLAFQGDALEIYREKLLTTAKMDPAIAQEQTAAELKTLWGRTGLTGDERVMRHPPEALYPPIGGDHRYIKSSFNRFAEGEEIPEAATDVQLISTDITSQDKRNNQPPRYMVGWFEYTDTGQRIWQMSPNFFVVGNREQQIAASVAAVARERAARRAQKPEEEMADIMALPQELRERELTRLRAGGRAADVVRHNLAIREAERRTGLSLEARTEAGAEGAAATAEQRGRAETLREELGVEGEPVNRRSASAEVAPSEAPSAEFAATAEDRMMAERLRGQAEVGASEAPTAEAGTLVVGATSVSGGEKAALVAGLGKKAAQRLLAGGSWDRVVEGLIENSELGGSSEQAAARREAHDMRLQAIGIDPRSERLARPGNMARLQRGILELKQRMEKGNVSAATQDAIIAKVRNTAFEMMQGRR